MITRRLEVRYNEGDEPEVFEAYLAKAERGGRIDPDLSDEQNARQEIEFQIANMIVKAVRKLRESKVAEVQDIVVEAG